MPNSPKFLLDENIPRSVKQFLESKGFSAEYTLKGISNSKAIALAKKKKSVFITRDTDFLNTSLFPPKDFPGILVLQIHPPKAEKIVKALASFLAEVKEFKGKLFVIEENWFKIVE